MKARAPFRRRAAGLVLLASALTAGACARRDSVFPRANVVLIVVDTLRADRLPAYGYRGVETPALDALARESMVFTNAVAQVPLTLPSHAALLTGLMPFQNGVRDNVGYRLDASRETLAAHLAAKGYSTGAAVSAVVLDGATGIGRGFEFYEDRIEGTESGQAMGQVQRSGAETARRLEEWIGGLDGKRPFFAFLHIYEPHTPYTPPEPFRTRYAKSAYDGEVAASDEIVGKFLGFLRERGLYDGSLLVFLSDHGEGLGEHGEDEHGILLYRETVRVPLFVKLPKGRRAGARVELPAQVADVFPTVAAAVAAPLRRKLPGASLLDLADGRVGVRSLYSETLYPRYHFGWSDLASLTDDRHQYIQAPRSELYDWREDPGELRNLSAGSPPAFRKLRVELAGMDRPLQAPGAADPETVQKLASLGYIGQASPEAADKDLPDPKDKIATLATLKDAGRLSSQYRDDEAAAMLRQFAAENPRMLDAWEALARALRRAGRPEEAIEALERADRLSPGTSQIVMGLANLNLAAGRFDQARALTGAARELGATGTEEQLAAIALAQGDLAAARDHADAARRQDPEGRFALLLLARVEARQGRHAAALSLLDELLAIEQRTRAPAIEGVRATRGDVLGHLGREPEAEEDFRREIREFPGNLDAWSRLALLYAANDRRAEFAALLLEMTRRVPSRNSYAAAAKVCEIVGDQEGARKFRGKTPPRGAAPSS